MSAIKKLIIQLLYRMPCYRNSIIKGDDAMSLLVVDSRNEKVIYYPQENISAYKFAVLLNHFANKSIELDYWLEIVPCQE